MPSWGKKSPTQSIFGLLLLSYLGALFLEESLRRPAFIALFLGGMLHVGVDHFRDSLGWGTSHVFYPLTPASYEIPCINPENLVLLVPLDLALLGILWLATRNRSDLKSKI